MRLVYKVFVDPLKKSEESVLFETDDDGSGSRVLQGTAPEPGEIRRVPVFVEVSADDSADKLRKTVDALKTVLREVQKRASKEN